MLRLYSGCTLHDILFTLFTSHYSLPAYWKNCICMYYFGDGSRLCPVAWHRWDIDRHKKGDVIVKLRRNTDRPTESIVIMIKRGQTHSRQIIRTRPLCMNPFTSTQLCQTAWSIIFSNSWGLESYYRAPSVTQTSVPKQLHFLTVYLPDVNK